MGRQSRSTWPVEHAAPSTTGHREKVLTTLADDLDLKIPKVRTGS
jgi:transposase-like protein